MTTLQTVGRYYLLEKRPDRLREAQSPKVQDRIRDIISRQVELRGEGQPFTFKALGYSWHYVPEGQ